MKLDETKPFYIYLGVFINVALLFLYFSEKVNSQANVYPTPTPVTVGPGHAQSLEIPPQLMETWLQTVTTRFFVNRLIPIFPFQAIFDDDVTIAGYLWVKGERFPPDNYWELGIHKISNSVTQATGPMGNQLLDNNLVISASRFQGIVVSGTDVRGSTFEMEGQPLTMQIMAETNDGEIVMKSFESPGRLQFIGRVESATQLVFDNYKGVKVQYYNNYYSEIDDYIWRDVSDRHRRFRADDSTEDTILFDLNTGSAEFLDSVYTAGSVVIDEEILFTIDEKTYRTAVDFYGGNRTWTIDIAEEVWGVTTPRYFDVQADNTATPGFRFDADSAIVDVTNIIKAKGLMFREPDTTADADTLRDDMKEGEMRYWKPSGGEIGLAFDAGDELRVQWLTHYDNRVAGHNYPLAIRVTDELYLIRGHYLTD